MSSQAELLVFRELAELYERQGQPQLRDRFLLLAADAAQESGDATQADMLASRLLRHSPHHMLKPFASFAEALHSPDVRAYLGDLKESYPIEVAQQMLTTLKQASPPRETHGARPNGKEAEDAGTLKFPPGRRHGPAEHQVPAEPIVHHSSPSGPLLPPAVRTAAAPQMPRLNPAAERPARPPRLDPHSPERVIPMPRREGRDLGRGETAPPRSTANAAVAMLLFVLTLLLGLALAGYTFLKPFIR